MRRYRPCAWCGRPTVRAELVEAHLPPYGPWPAWLRAADWVVWLCPDCFGVPPAAPPSSPPARREVTAAALTSPAHPNPRERR